MSADRAPSCIGCIYYTQYHKEKTIVESVLQTDGRLTEGIGEAKVVMSESASKSCGSANNKPICDLAETDENGRLSYKRQEHFVYVSSTSKVSTESTV